MNVVIVGTGYVGLVSGSCFAEIGANVTCVDVDEDRIARIRSGEMPIYEPGLEQLVSENVKLNRLAFTSDLSFAVSNADLVFISVGTPARRGDGHADLKYVYKAAAEVAQHLVGYTVIVGKSTVPVGTARQVQRIITTINPGADFDVASNPEFLREGSAIRDFMRPDRIVLGLDSQRAESLLRDLYRPLNDLETPLLTTDLESAELIKYASNAFLATKISFINEMSMLCEEAGGDIFDVAKGLGLDSRIGQKFLQAGPGFGGSCFPKDTRALIRMAQEHQASCRIVEAVVEVNAAQKARMVLKIRDALGGSETGKTIAVLGLTFKPDTDDMRDAPSLSIIPALVDRGAKIKAHDPHGIPEAKTLLPSVVTFHNEVYRAIEGADAIVLMTEWTQYGGLDLDKVKSLMSDTVFVDLRNVYDPTQMRDAGFQYVCVGRGVDPMSLTGKIS